MARTYLDLQQEVLDYGFSPTRYRASIKRWLNDALKRVYRKLDFPENQTEAAVPFVAGTREYSLPADFIRLSRSDDEGSLRIELAGAADLPVHEVPLVEINARDETATGRPLLFALKASTFVVWPAPDATYTGRLPYWAGAAEMVADTDVPNIPDEYCELLVAYALSLAYGKEDDDAMARQHGERWSQGLLEMGGEVQFRSEGPKQVAGMLAVWPDETGDPELLKP